MMNAPYMQNYYQNPSMQQAYQQQMQNQYEQRLQNLQNQLTTTNNQHTNRIIPVASAQEAQNSQIPMDGTVTYFVFGDTILAKNWSFASGKIENVYFKKFIEAKAEESPKPDRLDSIESKIDRLLNQSNLVEPAEKEKWQNKLIGNKDNK